MAYQFKEESTGLTLRVKQADQLGLILQQPQIGKLESLLFKNSDIQDQQGELLQKCKNLRQLKTLQVSENFNYVSDIFVSYLAKGHFQSLLRLDLSDNQISDQALLILADSPTFSKLTHLILYGNLKITSNSLRYIADSSYLTRLQVLDLHQTSINDQGLQYFFLSANCRRLRHINFSMNWESITDSSLISACYCGAPLQHIDFSDCKVTNQAVFGLSESQNLRGLSQLLLNNNLREQSNRINDTALRHLGNSKVLQSLAVLQLRNSEITSQGLKYFFLSQTFNRLQTLRVSHCPSLTLDFLTALQKRTSVLKRLFVTMKAGDKDAAKRTQDMGDLAVIWSFE